MIDSTDPGTSGRAAQPAPTDAPGVGMPPRSDEGEAASDAPAAGARSGGRSGGSGGGGPSGGRGGSGGRPTGGLRGLAARHPVATPAVALVALNAAFVAFGLWYSVALVGIALNFVAIVWLAQSVQEALPHRHLRRYEKALAALFPVLLVIGWELLSNAAIVNPRWFPPPTEIAGALWQLTVELETDGTSLLGRPWLLPELVGEHGFFGALGVVAEESHVYATLSRVILGFGLGLLPGIVIGALMGYNRTVRLMLDNIMSAFYVLPKIAIFPLMMLMFADPFGEGPIITVVAISAFFFVAFNAMAGVRNIDPIFMDVGTNYGANRVQMFRHVIIPGALPVIFAGFRIALGAALIVVVAVEFVRADRGVGHLTIYYWEVLSPPHMFAGFFTTMALGVLLTFGLLAIEKRVMPWRRGKGGDLPAG